MKVIVAGGGSLGYNLARHCLQWGYEVSLLERDKEQAEKIKSELGIRVVCGDATSPHFMRKAAAKDADLVVAVTGDDHDNLAICQMAERQFNAGRTLAVVNKPGNEKLFRWLGVNQVISPVSIILNSIRNEVDTGTLWMQDVHHLKMVQFCLGPQAPVVGSKVKDIRFPEEAILVTIVRGEKAVVPRGDTELEEGDLIFALANPVVEGDLRQVLTGASRLIPQIKLS